MKFFPSLKINNKLLASFIAFFLPLAALGTIFVYLQVKKAIEAGIESELSNTTAAMLRVVQTHATVSIRNHLRAIAEKNLEIAAHYYHQHLEGRYKRQEAVDRIKEVFFAQTIGRTGYIYCIDSRGNAVVHPRDAIEGLNFSHLGFIQEQIRKKRGYIEYQWKNPEETAARPKALYMTYFAPLDWIISVSSYRDEFKALINFEDFKESILDLRFGKSGHVSLVDDKGVALVHPVRPGAALFDDRYLPESILAQMTGTEGGRIDFRWQGPEDDKPRQRILFYAPVEGFAWFVVASTYTDEVFEPLYAVRNMILVALMAALVLATSVTFLVSRSITRPLESLMERFSAGAQGDLSVRMRHESQDELGRLAAYFNEFMDRLESYRNHLTEEIAERRQTEKALRESERRYRKLYEKSKREEELYISLLNSSPDAIVVYDMAGRVKYLSPAFTRIFGWTFKELEGKKIPFVPDSEFEASMRIVARLIKDGTPCSGFETRRYDKDRNLVDVSISGSRYHDHEGNPEGMLVILRDISDTKKLEAQVQHAMRMEAIGTLAGGIAHDFNNLLMGIQGRVSLLLMDLSADHPHYDHLRGVEEHVKAASDLTRQLLGFARGGKYQPAPLDLNRIVENTAEMFGRTRKEIAVSMKLQRDGCTVEADRSQFEQVLLNLFVNAWQAMADGGTLTVETHSESLSAETAKAHKVPPGRYARIRVADTGVGMAEAMLQRIFDPFFTTKERSRGTGLGLSSAYGIVRNHGGFIAVESRPNQGAVFDVYLPASEKPPAEPERQNQDLFSGNGTVLLVDDEPMILDIGKSLLEKIGYTVLTAAGGREAVDTVRSGSNDIRVVILDMVMPDMAGDEAFEKIRAIAPDLKILLASGYSVEGKAQNILDRGCDGFIQKPFTILELSEKLKDVLKADG